MDYFSLLPKDVLIQLALEYDLSSLNKFCQSSKKINRILNNHTFWYNKLIKEFGLYKADILQSLTFRCCQVSEKSSLIIVKKTDINQ